MQLLVASLLPYPEDMGGAPTDEKDLFNMQVVSDFGVSFYIHQRVVSSTRYSVI